ncbi:nicotinamide riboside kinase 1 [Belonocnema kinseyi]|uniref:nicotinamide riboside kinase 1 n=1 Tax=Belonocnema kinseyi TaxID=2817044 RepID=UPI00143E0CF3|nr:nicotinamide riboside kinase 1 [Belonocnema kinseyi]
MGWLVIGISGATCSGKTSLARRLHKNLKNSILIEQDTYFLPVDDPRQTWIPKLNHINFDLLSSLDMEKMHTDILKFLNEKSRGNSTSLENEAKVLIVEGFLIFDYKPISDLCNLKYFLTLKKEECWNRRALRVYQPPDVPGYFDEIVWPEYLKYIDKVTNDKDLFNSIKFFDGTQSPDQVYANVYNEIELKLA